MDNITNIDTTTQLNDLISKLNQQKLCGPTCQKEKKSELLRNTYLEAERNIKNGENNLVNARKNYYEYAFGKNKYNKFHKEELTKKADKILDVFSKKYNTDLVHLKNEQKENDDKNKYIKYLEDLLNKYKSSNKNYNKSIDKEIDGTNLAHRKVFYETERYEYPIEVANGFLYYYMRLTLFFYAFAIIYYGLYKNRIHKILFSILLYIVYKKTILYYIYYLIRLFFNLV